MILKQAEQFPARPALNWRGPQSGDPFSYAESPRNKYLIEPPGMTHRPESLPQDKILLHTKTNSPYSDYQRWGLHSAHDSMDSAMAAAQRHDQESGHPVDLHAVMRGLGP